MPRKPDEPAIPTAPKNARAAPKKVTKRRLENIAKFYIQRFATTAAHLKRVLMRRAERGLRAHNGDRAECTEWVEEIVARFVKTGLVDDVRYAMAKTESLRRLGKGPGKIRALLAAKGVDRTLIARALDASAETAGGEDAAWLAAVAYARRRRLGPFGEQSSDREEKRRKVAKDLAAMGRAGFSYTLAKRVANAASVEDLGMTPAMRNWLGFAAMTVGMFLAILDVQIVASSLIDIQLSLKIPGPRLSYIQTIYLIAEVIAIALTGFLTRVMSTRWLFVAAMLGFVLASIACAASADYATLYVARFVQGLFGGAIIPIIFSAAFLMFPERQQTFATVIGGGFAMLAPTVGPYVGGWITENLSWHWLFLINVIPGIAAATIAAFCVRFDRPDWRHFRTLDAASLTLLIVFLATLELVLKEAPRLGWGSPSARTFLAACIVSGAVGARRCLRRRDPIVDLRLFRDRTFAVGAFLSFVLGMALFGSTYLLPVFLGLVRDLGPLAIGSVMIVSGIAQLLTAPIATVAEQRLPPRALTAFGYALLAAGLIWNGFATYAWDFDELFGPQVLRGVGFMICLLPVTRLALGQLPAAHVPNASALFNLMRNIGGAVGLGIIDTVIEQRSPHHVERIAARLQAGDRDMAAFVGLPLERFTGVPLAEIDQAAREFAEPLVRRAAAVASFNDAWFLLGGLIAIAVLATALMKRPSAVR